MTASEGPSLYCGLIGALEALDDNHFQKFKLCLTDRNLLQEFQLIERKQLETQDKTQILKAMMDTYGIYTIVVSMRVLKQLGCAQILEELSKHPHDPEALITEYQNQLKSRLQSKFHTLVEEPNISFCEFFTNMHISLANTGKLSEVREMTHSRKPSQEEPIQCEELFKAHPHSPEPVRVVLMKGVAGVGKTVLTQKFSLDWAEGRAHQDLQLLFPFTFRELNVLRDKEFSLVELLHHFFSPSKDLCWFQQLQVLFIFDGLDQCRPPLDFSRTRVLTDPTESASVHVLLVNLIRGSLLPSSRLWITTRPAAANQIPAEYVSMVTEVRGFTEPQKEQYFRKRFRDQATAIISHIKSIRSLHIMSHIPIFCWILSTVLQKLPELTEEPEFPRTLTQMFIYFLMLQAKVQNIKDHLESGAELYWISETREMVRSLGKLAFEQLQKGNLIFYESDLSECGLDTAAASLCSGIYTQVLSEESGLYQHKVYCFIHLSVQEFLAALHVHQTFFSSGENLLDPPHPFESTECTSHESEQHSDSKEDFPVPSVSPDPEETVEASPESDPEEYVHYSEAAAPRVSNITSESKAAFHRSAVDQALQSPNGHLDLFLRFLLGLSLPTNQSLLHHLLTYTRSDPINKEIVKYIFEKINDKGLSAERSLNLFHCLSELKGHSLVQEIQWYMRDGEISSYRDMSPADWSTLSFLLLSSDSDLEEFDLRKYQASETALLNLLPVVRASTKAFLCGCGLSPHSCAPLASVLSSSSLTQLDLSNNDLQDSGVELLCSGLKSAPCRLETLRLSGCLVTERGGAALASALSAAPSHLRELDLSYNHPGPSAELLIALRDQRPLLSVRLDPAGECWMVPGLRKYFCEFSLDPNTAHRELLLSEDHQTVTCVEEEEYPHHEDRFTFYPQVLSCTGLRGRCYWEVDWSGEISIAVSYRGIRRRGKGLECAFGENHQSWSLCIFHGEHSVWHNMNSTRVCTCHSKAGGVSSDRGGVSSGRVGMFLDSESGVLSFYDVSSDRELFHLWTFSSSFPEPLFPGFGLYKEGNSVSLVKRQ